MYLKCLILYFYYHSNYLCSMFCFDFYTGLYEEENRPLLRPQSQGDSCSFVVCGVGYEH